ncbi:diguanylate cyclase [Xylophilus sp. Leaf220]|uniref:diguanylate cyclase n=1 Tax=Xylophilus sp. Leaf220 TaxID=1735686 RepID=UPI000714D2CC|nr:diguanylate cyclase [Xylophilus sp. Leaf220]KQM70057.1 hypothetical protein ASE76_09545 [Xylophilus sp. Leaf220]
MTGVVFAMCLICAPAPAPAHAAALQEPPSISVEALGDSLLLGSRMQLLEDPGGRMELSAVQHASGWRSHGSNVFAFGFSQSVWWARVLLRNDGAAVLSLMLEIDSPLQDEVDIHLLRTGGPEDTHVFTGDRRPFAARGIATVVPAVPVRLSPGESVAVYLRLATHDGLHEPITTQLWTMEAFHTHLQGEHLVIGMYYGALVTLLLYNLFLFASTRQPNFGLYALYVAAFLLWSFTFRGYAFQYLWPEAPVFNSQVLPISVAACFTSFVYFMLSYIDARRQLSRGIYRAVMVLAVFNALSAVPALFNHYALPIALCIVADTALMGFAFFMGVRLGLAGSRPALYLLLAFSMLALSVTLYYLSLAGLLPSVGGVKDLPLIGSMLEILLLAFGLADQMNTLKAAKLRAERRALAAQTALTTGLEREVAQRTAALAAANQRLADMAITDELTGAFNRRHFNAVLAATMARHARLRTPVAFCMVDVDHFKQYNDRYGHPAGDLVLQAVSRVVRERLARAGDHFFRIGGEEFGILMDGADTLSATRPFVEQVRAAIEALALPHAASPHGVVTASFGLVLLETGDHPIRGEELVARADRLLYDAKHAGRNRVVAEVL